MALADQLHNASYSYENVPGGRDIVFHDPFVGQPLDPNRVPNSIAGQTHLNDGLNHLAHLGHGYGHTVTIAGSAHGEGASPDLRQLESLVARHDIVFLEGIGQTARHRKLVAEVGRGRTDIPEDIAADIGDHGLLQLTAISGNPKPIYYGDLPGDGTPFDTALTEWGDLARRLTAIARTKHGQERNNLFRAALINIAGNTILREWSMLGFIGNALRDAERRGHSTGSSLFLLGTEHTRTLPRKLGLLGVSSSTIELSMHHAGTSDVVEFDEFDFTTAVRDYRARIKTQTTY